MEKNKQPWLDPGPSWKELQRKRDDAGRLKALLIPTKANWRTALFGGVVCGVSLGLYSFLGFAFEWTRSEQNFYFLLFATLGFLLPSLFLVAGLEYILSPWRSPNGEISKYVRAWGRMAVFVVGMVIGLIGMLLVAIVIGPEVAPW